MKTGGAEMKHCLSLSQHRGKNEVMGQEINDYLNYDDIKHKITF